MALLATGLYFLLGCSVLLSRVASVGSSNPFFCCHQNSTTLPPDILFSITNIIFHAPKQCQERNVWRVYVNTTKGYKQPICLNGFSLMSFTLALMDMLLDTAYWLVDKRFYNELARYKVQFSAELTANTTDSSMFKTAFQSFTPRMRNGGVA
nr:ORF47 glycoprotein L [Ovine gammaherpesvirus 2]